MARAAPALTAAQIAARVGCSPSTVQRHLRTLADIRAAGRPASRQEWVEQLTRSRSTVMLRSPAMLWCAAREPNVEARKAAARHPGAPVALLRQLGSAGERSDDVRAEVASNPNTDPGLLSLLAKTGPHRRAVLRNPNCPTRIIDAAVRGGRVDDRQSVTSNRACPAGVLMALCTDTDRYVRLGVAAHRSAPPQALARLARSPDAGVRKVVAGNKSCPRDVLDRLAADPDMRTQTAAQLTRAHYRASQQ